MKHLIYIILLAVIVLSACDSRPRDVLSRGKMEDVLYDYHLMQGIIDQLPDSERFAKAQDYINAVFEKHNITEAQFDSSITYYNRNTKDLAKIYSKLKTRFSDEYDLIQTQTGNNDFNAIFAGGDTADIWAGAKMILLSNKDILRTECFSILCDTSSHQHDQFTLLYTPLFLAGNSEIRGRSISAGLSIVYKGGKTVGITQQVSFSNPQQLTLKAHDDTDIEKVNIFFFFRAADESRSSCIVNNISLVQMHEKVDPSEKQDTVKVKTVVADSLKADTVETPSSRNITAEEARQENKSDQTIHIQTKPSMRSPNSYGPRRRPVNQQRERRKQEHTLQK